MVHLLPSVLAVVDHHAVAILQPLLGSDFCSYHQEVAKELLTTPHKRGGGGREDREKVEVDKINQQNY